MTNDLDLIILIFLYCIIFSCIPFILFNFYKLFEKYILSESVETDPYFLNIFNDLKKDILPINGNVVLYKNWKFLTLFCAFEVKGSEYRVHMNNILKKDPTLYKSILAHELFHVRDKLENKTYSSNMEKETVCDLRAASIVGKDNYVNALRFLSTKWYIWDGETHPKWKERISLIELDENRSI